MNLRHFPFVALGILLSLQVACTSDGDDPGGGCAAEERLCAGSCVDLQSDPAHCGACDKACPEGESCSEGSCVASCPEGLQACGAECVDLQKDESHCGRCNEACAPGEVCSKGSCAAAGAGGSGGDGGGEDCEDGLVDCGAGCVDLRSSDAHCGACGTSCPEGKSCQDGQCACPAGWLECDGVCVAEDAQNCGSCGTSCGADQICLEGACVCTEGKLACTEGCVDGQVDIQNCGACGVKCEGGEKVLAAACVSGTCELSCESNHENCDGDPSNGCEAHLMTDTENCGTCGNDCSNRANAVDAICQAGNCSFDCAAGWGNCDVDPANGCEADLNTSVRTCGSCGNDCLALPQVADATCRQGACELLACEEGWGDCDDDLKNGCEIDLRSHRRNCGSCGASCTILCGEGSCLEVTQLALGYGHTCALLSNGKVACWGNGSSGVLGDGQTEDRHYPYVLELEDVIEISAGESHTCALKRNGQVWCWGANLDRQLGHEEEDFSTRPVYVHGLPKVISIGLGEGLSCAIGEDGSVWCWGRNWQGESGQDIAVTTKHAAPMQVSGISGAVRVRGGRYHACALTDTGKLFCWGWNDSGQLGDGTFNRRHKAEPTGLEGVVGFDLGLAHTCALLDNGQVRCVGYNENGQLGAETQSAHHSTWETFQAAGSVSKVQTGLNATCVLISGKVWCAGRNDFGILGRDMGYSQSGPTPVEINGLPPLVDFAMGQFHACGKSQDGEIWCWGFNADGQLAIGTAPPDGDFMREVPGLALWEPPEEEE